MSSSSESIATALTQIMSLGSYQRVALYSTPKLGLREIWAALFYPDPNQPKPRSKERKEIDELIIRLVIDELSPSVTFLDYEIDPSKNLSENRIFKELARQFGTTPDQLRLLWKSN